MTQPLLRLVMAAVRGWTRAYTWHLPPALRDRRRGEIESDLWESAHDPAPDGRAPLPLRICARLLIGIPDDLGWRLEQVNAMDTSRLRIPLTLGVLGILGLALVLASRSPETPPLPDAPHLSPRAVLAPPPPPPPPAPDGRRPDDIPLIFGDTSYTAPGVPKPPIKIRDVRPVYPPMAVWGGIRGRVAVEATIDERGRVAEARIVKPSNRMLDQSALDAVKQWEFEPTPVNGEPRPVAITVTVHFTPTQ